jgi:hypothetical protein
MRMPNPARDDPLDFEFDDRVPEKKIRWNGSTIVVTARLVPRYSWTTASIDVFLDGRCILRTGGQMKVTGSSWAEFDHDGSVHTVELSWGLALGLSFPYQLRIDGAMVAVSEVPVASWGLVLMPFLIGLSAMLAMALLGF